MQYHPKLKKAMKQIEDILKENDIAGVVILHTPGYSEFLNHCLASYSCARVEPNGVRLKLSPKEIGKEKAQFLADNTYNMVTHFAKVLGDHSAMYNDLHKILKEKLGGQDFGSGYTSHQSQNN